ncbi:MAG: hypothetical protein IKZ78_03990, partial [Firmicutes bacterium]|nr:hypothetical protein [Bacillota bacterium]
MFPDSPVAYAQGAPEIIGCSTAYYQAFCPANSDTAAGGTFESRPLSVDENCFYHFLPTDSGKTLTEPYTLTKGNNSTFEVIAATTITGLGTAETAAVGSDLQGQYLYLIINDKTALIDKNTLEWEIINFEFGQTNIIAGDYIYSLKA